MNPYITIIFFISTLNFNSPIYAQQSINASGGNVENEFGSMSFSVGQLLYHTVQNESISIIEGVQQAFDISVVTQIKENEFEINLSAFPNPTSSFLNLSLSEFNPSLEYMLFDGPGSRVSTGRIIAKVSQIDMQYLASGLYFLSVFSDGKLIKTFKVIKN
ncbi:MAG: T9SS type A sorting domain-containing protein [Luteibaculaceae bacterium]